MFNSHIPTEIHLKFSLCDFCKIINRRTTITFGSLTDKLLRIITFWGNVSILALALAAQDAHRPPACVRNHSFSRCSACQIFLSADFSHFFILSIWFSMHCFYVSPQNQLSFGDKLGWSWVFQLQRRDSSQTDSHADERRETRGKREKKKKTTVLWCQYVSYRRRLPLLFKYINVRRHDSKQTFKSEVRWQEII